MAIHKGISGNAMQQFMLKKKDLFEYRYIQNLAKGKFNIGI